MRAAGKFWIPLALPGLGAERGHPAGLRNPVILSEAKNLAVWTNEILRFAQNDDIPGWRAENPEEPFPFRYSNSTKKTAEPTGFGSVISEPEIRTASNG